MDGIPLPAAPGHDIEGDEAQAWLNEARGALLMFKGLYVASGQNKPEVAAKIQEMEETFEKMQERLARAKVAKAMLQAPNN